VQDSLSGDEFVFGLPAGGDLTPAIPAEEVEDPDDDPLVLAVEVYNPTEAELVCALLTAHDIPCLLKAENQYAVDATYTLGPLARRRILVRTSDLPRAQDILSAAPEAEAGPE
jgi:hypothetical protein